METKETEKSGLTIGLCLIATGKYDRFLDPLLESVDTHFFPASDVIVYLFTDKEQQQLRLSKRMSLIQIPIEHKPWPASTLFRYRHFSNAAKKIGITDFAFYIDVDMMIVSDLNEDLLTKNSIGNVSIFGTRHPGFWNNSEWGSQGVITSSKAYLEEHLRDTYYAGGFQGGETDKFLEMSRVLADNIDYDLSIGYTAPHNDETHFNFFMNKMVKLDEPYNKWSVCTLTPSFCMIPEEDVRAKFGLSDLPPIIYALSKDHEELRKH